MELNELNIKLAELHRRKIDLADEILVLNVGGYNREQHSRRGCLCARTGQICSLARASSGRTNHPQWTLDSMARSTLIPEAHLLLLQNERVLLLRRQNTGTKTETTASLQAISKEMRRHARAWRAKLPKRLVSSSISRIWSCAISCTGRLKMNVSLSFSRPSVGLGNREILSGTNAVTCRGSTLTHCRQM